MDSSTITLWTDPFPIKGCLVVVVFLLLCFKEIPVFNANSVDPDQMPHSAASDLGLHCLQKSLLWDTRHIWYQHKPLSNIWYCYPFPI